MTYKVDKAKLLDTRGVPLTQSLFLEIGYNTDFAVYTLKEDDHEYNGVVYPSLKRLFLEHEDPVEYDFAKTYLLGFPHWKRLNGNKLLRAHFDEWREELEMKIRSQAVRDMITLCASESGNFSATKWLADKGWDKRLAGRPTKAQKDKEEAQNQRIADEYGEDFQRMKNFKVVK